MHTIRFKSNKQIAVWAIIGVIFLLTIGSINSSIARADGGGFPTLTPTITRTVTPTLPSTAAPTATFTSLPPYPFESSGGEQPMMQQVASSPTSQPVAPPAESGFSLGGCLPTGILILLAGILLLTFYFARRTRKKAQ